MKKIYGLTLLTFIFCTSNAFADASFIDIAPMVIRGEDLPPHLLGKPIAHLSLMSVQQGQLKPMPYQIDALDESGLIYIPGLSKKPPAGPVNKLDLSDEIVFMLRDAGEQLSVASSEKILQEIKIQTPEPCYVYLVENNNQRSSINYLRTSLKKGTLQTPALFLKFNPKNLADIQQAALRQGDGYSKNLLAKLELSASAGILSSLFTTHLSLKDNIEAKPIGVKEGPVRSTFLLRTTIKWIGIPFYHSDFSINFYPYSIKMPSRFASDSLGTLSRFIFLLKNPQAKFNIYLTNLNQGHFHFDSLQNPTAYCAANGRMGPVEQQVNAHRLPGDWIYFQNPSLQALYSNRLPLTENGVFDAFLKGAQFRLTYNNIAPNQARFSVELEGLPKLALKLLPSLSKLQLGSEGHLQKFIDVLLAEQNQRRRHELDEVIKAAFAQLRKDQGIRSPTALARLLIADVNKIGISGIDRQTFNQLIHETFARMNKLDDFSIKNQLGDFARLAQQRGIDLTQVSYRAIDNTVWFPPKPISPSQLSEVDNLLALTPAISFNTTQIALHTTNE